MDMSLDLFLFFFMEKKLILLSHFRSIEYMRLVPWLWSLELNEYAFNVKNLPCWSSSYLVTSMTFFAIVDSDSFILSFFFSLIFVCIQSQTNLRIQWYFSLEQNFRNVPKLERNRILIWQIFSQLFPGIETQFNFQNN